jgi:WD40 repeat protein
MLYSLILASAAKDTLVKLWDIMDDGNLFQTLSGHPKIVNAVAWSSNAQKLVTVGAGKSVKENKLYKINRKNISPFSISEEFFF